MTSERKSIFSRGDLWVILFLLACMLLGTALTIYQKSRRRLPPQLLIETVKKADNAHGSSMKNFSRPTLPDNLRINLNTAPADSFELLPGIGPAFAQKIVDHRNQIGPFATVADLMKVKGIGPKMLSAIEKYLTVE